MTQRAITNTNMVKFRLSIINRETKANCSLIEEKFFKAKKRMALAKDRREQILYLRELPVYTTILRSLREDMQVEIWCILDERDRGQRNIEVMVTYLIIINFWPGNIFEERTPAEIDRWWRNWPIQRQPGCKSNENLGIITRKLWRLVKIFLKLKFQIKISARMASLLTQYANDRRSIWYNAVWNVLIGYG